MNFKNLDKELFKTEYANTENKVLATKYQVTESTIRVWAARLKITKEGGRWEPAQEILLLKYFNDPAHPNEDLAKLFNKTEFAIINKYRELTGKRAHLKGKYKKEKK
jgi:hypothetical protein